MSQGEKGVREANEAARDLRKLVDSVKHGEAACQAAQDLRDQLQQISNEAVKVSKTIHCEGDGTGPATPPDDPKFKQLAALKDKAKALNEQLKQKQKELADARQSLESASGSFLSLSARLMMPTAMPFGRAKTLRES